MILKRTYGIIFILCTCVPMLSFAQFSSEAELIKEADRLFSEKKYSEAMPLFGQLASIYPKEANYNFKYGACLIFGDRDKEKSLRFLRYAVTKSEVDPLAHFFLGKALHLNYYFKEAIDSYSKFISKVPAKNRSEYNVEREVEMCRNGIKLLSDIKDIDVVGKKETRKDEFYRSYDLKGIGGKIVSKPDDFRSKHDKKVKDYSVIYLPPNLKDEVFFASYGEDGKDGKDIYKVLRLPDGNWGKPVNIGAPINTPFDEDFPFMHPDGKTLYFSSKGHNSMGGYDIFKTVFDINSSTWSTPQNLDFAYSSPDDDFFFVTDEDMTLAYFASSRGSKEGDITIYRVKVQPKAADFVIIKGEFINESNVQMRTAKITITDLSNNQNQGEYFTNTTTGKYAILLPGKGGKYKFAIETTESAPIHSGMVEVPRQEEEVVALKQELRLVGEGDNEKLVIKNLFDQTEAFDVNDPLLVESIIRQKAKLDINTTEAQVLASITEMQENKENVAEIKNTNEEEEYNSLSNEDIAEKARNVEKELKQKIDALQNESNYAYAVSNGKSIQAKDYSDKADKIRKSLSNYSATDRTEKEKEAQQLKDEARKLANEALAAKKIAATLDNDIAELTSEFNNVSNLASAIQFDVSANKRDAAIEKLKKQQALITEINQTPSSKTIERTSLAEKVNKSKEETEKAENSLLDLTEKKQEIEQEIQELNAKLSNAKKKDKEELESQLKVLEIDKEDIVFQYNNELKQVDNLKKETTKLEAEYSQFENISKQVEENKTVVSAPSLQMKTETETTMARLEEKGLTGEQQQEDSDNQKYEATSNKLDLLTLKDEYDIINDEGKIKNYNNDFSNQLADTDKINDANQRNESISAINKNWVNAIQQEIEINQKQLELATSLNEKTQITSKINKLKDFKEQKEKDIISSSSLISANSSQINSSENNVNKNSSNEYIGKLTDIDNNKNFNAEEKENNKILVYKDWNEAILSDIEKNKVVISSSNKEEEKIQAERKIVELQEQYDQNMKQIESSENAIASVNTKSEETADNTKNNNENKNESEENADDFSNFKYKSNVKYRNSNALNLIDEANLMKRDAALLLSQAEALKEQSNKSTNFEEKNKINEQAEELEIKSQNIELQVAAKYAEANKSEFQKNNNALNSNTFINAVNKTDDATLASLMKEDADFYFNEARKIREEINDNMYFISKQTALQKAFDYEAKAIEKQQQALAIANFNSVEEISEDKTEIVSNNNTNYTNNNNVSENGNSVINNKIENNEEKNDVNSAVNNTNNAENKSNEIVENNKNAEENTNKTNSEFSNTNTSESKNNEIIDNAQNTTVNNNLLSINQTPEGIKSERLIKEAEILEEKAAVLNNQANNTRKKKEKEALIIEAQGLTTDATSKREEAEKLKENSVEKINENKNLVADAKNIQQKNKNSTLVSTSQTQLATNLTDNELVEINNNGAYTQYTNERESARRLAKEAEVEYTQSVALMNEANAEKIKADELRVQAESETDETKKEEILEKADNIEEAAEEKESESHRIAESARSKEKQAVFHDNQAKFAIADLSPERIEKIEAIERTAFVNPEFKNRLEKIAEVQTSLATNTKNESSNVQNENTSNNNVSENNNSNLISPTVNTFSEVIKMKIPEKLSSNIFVKANPNQAAYNNLTPIPSSTKEPEGLVFKVQIGAFRNPIPQDHFKGFAPIVSEAGPSGITRYTAGYFKDFNNADNAKIDIRKLGYNDAFVVAFLNGKRINIDQARAMLSGNQVGSSNNSVVENKNSNTSSNNQTQSTNTNVLPNTNNSSNTNEAVNDGFSTNVKTVEGLFYTVQVGVYSGTVKPEILTNIENVNSDRIPNNLVRYSSGRYKTAEEAAVARKEIIAKGIGDAFVTAYINGQRYTVDQARRMTEQGTPINNNSNNISNQNTNNTPNNNNNTNSSSTQIEKEEIEYKVNIGEYADDIPNDVAGVYLQLTGRGIKSYEKGEKTVYIIGSFNNFDDAENLKKEMIELGIENAKVVTFKNDKEVK